MAAGCSSSPTGPDSTGQSDYPERTSPENAIAKFEIACEAMDAGECLDCLSEDFRFYVNPADTQGDDALPEFWDRTVEAQSPDGCSASRAGSTASGSG